MKHILKPEKRQTLAEMASNQLKNAIDSGKLKPGERLLENEIANGLQIGRNAVREALRSLEKEGIVTITPYKGARVAEPDAEEVRQMFEAMSGLEAMCAGLAVRKMTDRDLRKIEDFHAQLENHFRERDHDRYLKVNWACHEFVLSLAGNEVLSQLIVTLHQKIQLYRKKQLYQPERFKASMEEHRAILEAFRTRDDKMVEEAMKNHLLLQGESLLA